MPWTGHAMSEIQLFEELNANVQSIFTKEKTQ